MGLLKQYYDDYLSAEDFDLMFDDEYEIWLENKNKLNKKKQNLWEDQKVREIEKQNNNR